MSKRLNVGVIGWLKYFDNEYAITVAACDTEEAKLAAFHAAHPETQTFTDYKTMAEVMQLDAVVISTPNWLHTEMACFFMEAGVDVFLEKPMGVNRDECDRVADCQEKTGRVCAVDFEMRVSAGMNRVRQIIDSGEIGTLNSAEFIHHRGGWLAKGNGVWRTRPEVSGGLYFMEICHEVDLLRAVMGEITHVQSFSHKNVLPQYPDNMPDNVVTHLWFEGGATGTILASHTSSVWHTPIEKYRDWGHDMQFIFTGTDGCIRIDDIERKVFVGHYVDYHPDADKGKRVELARLEDYEGVENFDHSIADNYKAFFEALGTGKPFHQSTRDAWKTHVVCLACEASAVEDNRRIAIEF